MPIDFAADLEAMFDLEAFGVPASYQPAAGGDPVSIVILLDTPDMDTHAAGMRVLAEGRLAHIQQAEIALPVRGDQLTALGNVYDVRERRLSDDGLLWTVELVEV
ncbi:head-tail joining protein [Oceanibaculum indicum]|uniref:Uncharacterized protein n=1 Tax=Oceanibaculum indicum P24 TaxID=1207063 RepID=K2IL83_9PROT|nr:hypothetical protein [Oceanibaculum indicum]EKE70891.1 hypothetical protein P24_15149 [Oceanibaculum indicum P24]